MDKRHVFVSFACGVDDDLRDRAVAESRRSDAAFEVTASSSPFGTAEWGERVRAAMELCDVVAVICGDTTERDRGVDLEIKISREFALRHFLLRGRPQAKKPHTAHAMDPIHPWKGDALDRLVLDTARVPANGSDYP